MTPERAFGLGLKIAAEVYDTTVDATGEEAREAVLECALGDSAAPMRMRQL
jgi:hypothetical protein